MKFIDEVMRYVKNYCLRHSHNVNLILHIIGVPQAFLGLYQLFTGRWKIGLINIFLGYLWQWLGHSYFEKNELGEIVFIKNLIKRCKKHWQNIFLC